MNREELLERENESWLAFVDAINAVPADRRGIEGVVPGWSTHDLVWHCAYWSDAAGSALERILGGDPDPADSQESEAEITAAGRKLTWDEVLQRAANSRERVHAAASAFDDLPQRAVEWIEGDTFDHYDEHAEQIRSFNS
jgi:hypothetical protein